ncbi:hypothetical protein A2U01_0015412, partial [Trifolium medium]|nr:hypothetical protein [Trifolium medium]
KVTLLEEVLGMMETAVDWGGEENELREPGFLMKEWTGFNEKGVVMGDLKGHHGTTRFYPFSTSSAAASRVLIISSIILGLPLPHGRTPDYQAAFPLEPEA